MALDPVFDGQSSGEINLLESKTFLMKDGKQKNGEDFLTQPIHVLEHPMLLNTKLSILSKTN
jgi:hypothetical protein